MRTQRYRMGAWAIVAVTLGLALCADVRASDEDSFFPKCSMLTNFFTGCANAPAAEPQVDPAPDITITIRVMTPEQFCDRWAASIAGNQSMTRAQSDDQVRRFTARCGTPDWLKH